MDAAPDFHRCHALQVLVWPHVVVPGDELGQRGIEADAVGHGPAIELLLQRTEETLDATVLPGTVALDGLVFDAELVEYEVEQRVIEDDLIVGADSPGFTVPLDSVEQVSQEGDRGLVRQRLEVNAAARAVIDDTEQEVRIAGLVGLAGAVHAPDAIVLAGTIGTLLELPALKPDLGLVIAQHAPDEVVADRVSALVAPVEDVPERTAAKFGCPCGQGNDLLAYPCGLGAYAYRRSGRFLPPTVTGEWWVFRASSSKVRRQAAKPA